MTQYLPQILQGLWVAISLTLIGYTGALVLGTVIAVFRVSPIPPLRVVGAVYVEILRNIPLLALLILFTFGLPDIGIVFDLYTTVAICLAIFNAAFVCEAIRTGINTVPVGQAEAARAIGLTFGGTLSKVVLPQAFSSMVQPLVNVFIGTLLGSSLASAIGVMDLLGDGVNIAARLESIAAPGAICISDAAYGYVRKAISLPFADLGPQTR